VYDIYNKIQTNSFDIIVIDNACINTSTHSLEWKCQKRIWIRMDPYLCVLNLSKVVLTRTQDPIAV